MSVSDEQLMAYADGEADDVTRQAVESALRNDAALAERVAAHRLLRLRVGDAFTDELQEPLPAAWVSRLRGTRPAPVSRRLVRRDRRPFIAALAASVVVGVLVGFFASRQASSSLRVTNGSVLAAGSLERALSVDPTGAAGGASGARIGVSFKSKSGEYCRSFTLGEAGSAGLACREGRGWRVQLLLSETDPQLTTYRTASSELPPELVSAVQARIDGEPLDAEGEAAALRRGWRAPP